MPAKDATVPNLVPRERLEAANQLSLATTYGSAPVAALLFAGLSSITSGLDRVFPVSTSPIDVALYLNALTYLVAALVIWRLDMPRRAAAAPSSDPSKSEVSFWRTIVDGWAFIGKTPLIRGLVVGMLGAFGAGGFVIGVAPTFSADLGAGSSGYGVLFASVFTGLAIGMWIGPRLLSEFTRWRLFAISIVVAGIWLALISLIPNIVLAVIFAALLGAGAGVAWVTGYTLLGLEVADELRGPHLRLRQLRGAGRARRGDGVRAGPGRPHRRAHPAARRGRRAHLQRCRVHAAGGLGGRDRHRLPVVPHDGRPHVGAAGGRPGQRLAAPPRRDPGAHRAAAGTTASSSPSRAGTARASRPSSTGWPGGCARSGTRSC